MVLVDTSVWIEHFRRAQPELIELRYEGLVLAHPFVSGELACAWTLDRRLAQAAAGLGLS